MADELIQAVWKPTGIIQSVPPVYLEIYPEFEKVSDKEILEVHKQAEIDMYGAPLDDGIIPDVAAQSEAPTEKWTKAEISDYASAHGIAVEQGATKDELLSAVRAAEEGV